MVTTLYANLLQYLARFLSVSLSLSPSATIEVWCLVILSSGPASALNPQSTSTTTNAEKQAASGWIAGHKPRSFKINPSETDHTPKGHDKACYALTETLKAPLNDPLRGTPKGTLRFLVFSRAFGLDGFSGFGLGPRAKGKGLGFRVSW